MYVVGDFFDRDFRLRSCRGGAGERVSGHWVGLAETGRASGEEEEAAEPERENWRARVRASLSRGEGLREERETGDAESPGRVVCGDQLMGRGVHSASSEQLLQKV
ncbi:uncharacterized protein A4U43_UnF8710 [Asparagus officinalis]|uniref:Uncharacterized protein n=1 Tax=Asparagus officinalis TaxID=4686 RepID=A0A1R3L5X4_ASPOF|nr:uncharacterized protein A4U43_UnF8710 [Asparagus officinalis]